MTERGTRVRYPDVTVACGPVPRHSSDTVEPVVLFEITSPSSVLTDERVKPLEYRNLPKALAYVVLDGEARSAKIMRRSTDWQVERVVDLLLLPEIDATVPLDEIYAAED